MSLAMANDTKEPKRVIIPFDKELLEEVDDYRFTERVSTRTEALKRLIRAGLDHWKTREPAAPSTTSAPKSRRAKKPT